MIPVLFNTLLFLIPLIFYKNTSELFEFNKIITVYIFTAVITSVWAIQMITYKKFIFRRTILDWPLIIYLSIYLISSLFSMDPRTSWLGYYSRFNGGLISQICYATLYWAFVSNMTAKNAKQSLVVSLWSLALASTLAILEHYGIFTTCGLMGFGFTESCWVQDVQNRVFSTLGQPNWLAAMLVALIPLGWSNIINSEKLKINNYLWLGTSILFFTTLLFTKSRSGLLAFGIESIIFWGFVFWQSKFKHIKEFLILFFVSVVLFFVVQLNPKPNSLNPTPQGNSLETGGTESGTIRKYVWLGAIEIFKKYPLFGSGVETFAFSFPKYKPVEHNLTSEWDFIYNKAHNEYLNYLANTGILGFSSYVMPIIFSIIQILKNSKTQRFKDSKQTKSLNFNLLGDLDFFQFGIFAGYVGILITNFFGFSVVPVSLLFFLLPAMAAVQSTEYKVLSNKTKLNENQIAGIIFVLCTMSYVLFCITKYWQADIHYNNARNFNKNNKTDQATQEINKAISISPNEPLYIAELALAEKDVDLSAKALDLNLYNQNIRNILISNLNSNSKETKEYLIVAEQIAEMGTLISPINPKIYYQLGILNLKNNKIELGLSNLIKSVELKPNYKEGRFALGLTYIDLKKYDLAIENLEYILINIDPNDDLTKKYLDEAKSASE